MKIQKIQEYIFYIFLFAIPFQGRKIFLTDFSFYSGAFTEYSTAFLYISDIFLLISAFLLLAIPYFTKEELQKKPNKSQDKILKLSLLLVLWTAISALVNNLYFEIGIFRILKMTEMTLMIFSIFIFFQKPKRLVNSLYVIAFSGIFQSSIGIYQFLSQKSFFQNPINHKIFGEPILSPEAPGIAKIIFEGEKIIRSYGTFPHPNILGGFLVFSLLISIYLYLQHNDYILSSIYKYFNINDKKCQVLMSFLFWTLLFMIQAIALLTSFSRSSWISLLITTIPFIIAHFKQNTNVSRETFIIIKKHKELAISTFLILVLILCNLQLFSNRILQDTNKIPTERILQNDTFEDRKFYNIVSRETINKNPITGSGPGTFIFQINRDLASEPWQYQPAHNIYLLITSEIGFIGLFIFLYIIIASLKESYKHFVSRETNQKQKSFNMLAMSISTGILFIGLFDHYFYTLQQGQMVFWFSIALLLITYPKEENVSRETVN